MSTLSKNTLSLTYLSIHYSDCFYECCSYLEFEDLLPFSFANKHYNKVSNSTLFWKNATLNSLDKYKKLILSSEFYSGLKYIKTLRYHMSNYEGKKEEEKEENDNLQLSTFSKLENLSIYMWVVYGNNNDNKTINKQEEFFFQALPCSTLKSLSISSSFVVDCYSPLYNSMILQLPLLTKLSLTSISLISFHILENLVKLEDLTLNDIRILAQEENGKELVNLLNQLKNLTSLSICDLFYENKETRTKTLLTFKDSSILLVPNLKELYIFLLQPFIINTFLIQSNLELDKLILNGKQNNNLAKKELDCLEQSSKRFAIKQIELRNLDLETDLFLMKFDQIESLTITNSNIKGFAISSFTGYCSFLELNKTTLTELKLEKTKIYLSYFPKLPFLQKLYLKDMYNLIPCDLRTISTCFPHLQELKMVNCKDITHMNNTEKKDLILSNPYSLLLSLCDTLKEFRYVGLLKEETIHILQTGFKTKFKYTKK